jgi:hypothetical protein
MLRLSPEEKAETRGVAATGMPSRQIGRVMGRADRTVGDYIDRMKQRPPRVRTRASMQLGRRRYRAVRAEDRAWVVGRRRKVAKLAGDPVLRAVVEENWPCSGPRSGPRSRSQAGCGPSSPTRWDTGEPRDDLPVVVRAVPWRVAP